VKNNLKRIGILTGDGDCPGLNAVIRSIAKPAMTQFNRDWNLDALNITTAKMVGTSFGD